VGGVLLLSRRGEASVEFTFELDAKWGVPVDDIPGFLAGLGGPADLS
jgi:hypothetical protein